MDNGTASINIPKDLLVPAIQAHVQAALAEALGAQSTIIEAVARQICMRKVNSSGAWSTYESRDDKTLVEYLTTKALREAVDTEIRAWIEENRAKIAKAVRAKIKTDPKIAESICDGFMAALTGKVSYAFHVAVAKED